MRKLLFSLSIIATSQLLLSGCAPIYFSQHSVDPETGVLFAKPALSKAEVMKYDLEADLSSIEFFYADLDSVPIPVDEFEQYLKRTFESLALPPVYGKQDFLQWQVKSGNHAKVDVEGAYPIQESDEFFILNARLRRTGETSYRFNIDVIRPRDAMLLLSIERDKRIWANFDKEVMNPVLNTIKKWYLREALSE